MNSKNPKLLVGKFSRQRNRVKWDFFFFFQDEKAKKKKKLLTSRIFGSSPRIDQAAERSDTSHRRETATHWPRYHNSSI